MHQALAIAILSIGAVFVSLTVLIVLNKMWRETRDASVRTLRRELEPKVLSFSHGDGPSIVSALGRLPRGRERRAVEAILLQHVQRVKGIEHERLARALDELGYVDQMIAGLGSRRWWRRAESAEKLGLAGARRAIEPLAEALADDVSEVRMRAAKALGALGGTASTRVLIAALDEPNRWSTIRIADILTGMGRQVVDELIAAFPGLSDAGKLATLDILGRIRPIDRAPWIVERLQDPAADVRARACHALGRIGDPAAVPALVAALRDDRWPVRAMAAKALGWIRSPESVPALSAALRDGEWWVRSNAARALRAAGDGGLQALERMLDDEDTYARHQAVLMLQEAGVVDRHAEALAEPAGDNQRAAAAFVRRLVAAGQVERLRALAADHPSDDVRRRLASILPGERPEAAG